MESIYSVCDPAAPLLHMFHHMYEISNVRNDLSPPEEYMQVATFRLAEKQTFRPHRHIEQPRQISITQEMWVVLSGQVRVSYYDLDDKLLRQVMLGRGDLTITFRGGHTYEALEDNTCIVECKNGPYQGQAKDKVFIDGK